MTVADVLANRKPWHVEQGDALTRLRTMPAKSVHMVVTSPPYWGLRHYGIGQWEGGDVDCSHASRTDPHVESSTLTGGKKTVGHQQAGDRCQACGAVYVSQEMGSEPTMEAHIAALVGVFREVRRVLRDDGTLWVNYGDAWAGSWGNYAADGKGEQRPQTEEGRRWQRPAYADTTTRPPASYLPQGQLLGLAWRLAFALQEDGWLLRSAIVWDKPAPMPESVNGWRWERHRLRVCRWCGTLGKVSKGLCSACGKQQGVTPDNPTKQTSGEYGRLAAGFNERWREGAFPDRPQQNHDGKNFAYRAKWADCPGCPVCAPNNGLVLRKGSWRPTESHEFIFMLAKRMGYFCDAEAVKEPTHDRGDYGDVQWWNHRRAPGDDSCDGVNMNAYHPSSRNPRDVWRMGPEPLSGISHYAAFPAELPARCIRAATSEKGVCGECGAPWTRVVDKPKTGSWHDHSQNKIEWGKRQHGSGPPSSYDPGRTVGWRPTCAHAGEPVPAIVLDPFAGTGSTLIAAVRLGRRTLGVELSPKYVKIARKRIATEAAIGNTEAVAAEVGEAQLSLMETI